MSATMGESSVAVMTMFASTMDCFLSAMAQVAGAIDKLSTPKLPFGSRR